MELIKAEVRVLYHSLDELMSDFPVSCSDCFVRVRLEEVLDVWVKLEELLEGFIFYLWMIEHATHKLFVLDQMHWVVLVVVNVFKEGVVTLAVTSCHLNLSNSSSIGHIAHHT